MFKVSDKAASLDIEIGKAALEEQIYQLEIQAEETGQSVTVARQRLRYSTAECDYTSMARIRAHHHFAMENSASPGQTKEENGKLQQIISHIQNAKVRYKEQKKEAKYRSNVEAVHNKIEALDGCGQGLTTGGWRVLEKFNLSKKQLDMMNKVLTKNIKEQDRHQSRLQERKDAFLSWLKSGTKKM